MISSNNSSKTASSALTRAVADAALPLNGPGDLNPLLDAIGDARYVLLGEASHGTSEFYTWRTAITKRLIAEKQFSFIGVEGDWPDCYRVNRFVKSFQNAGTTVRELRSTNRSATLRRAGDVSERDVAVVTAVTGRSTGDCSRIHLIDAGRGHVPDRFPERYRAACDLAESVRTIRQYPRQSAEVCDDRDVGRDRTRRAPIKQSVIM